MIETMKSCPGARRIDIALTLLWLARSFPKGAKATSNAPAPATWRLLAATSARMKLGARAFSTKLRAQARNRLKYREQKNFHSVPTPANQSHSFYTANQFSIMAQINASRTKFLGFALLGFSALATGALLGGCSHNAVIEPEAKAVEAPTAKPKPKPTPGPTPRPKKPGIALYKVNTKQKVFALTFDDGPDPSYTPSIVKILKAKKAPATFFMVGAMVRYHAPTGKLVVDGGFPIGNHTWTHPMKTKNPARELDTTDAVIKEKYGLSTVMFRPPYGILKNGLAREASKRDKDVILWSSDSEDWKHGTGSATVHNNVMRYVSPGGIALMHDGGGNRSATVAALPGIIDAIRARGYKLVTVPTLLTLGKPDEAAIGGVTKAKGGKKHAKAVVKAKVIAKNGA